MDRVTLFFDARCTLCQMWRDWVELAIPDVTFADANNEAMAAALGIRDAQKLRDRMCLLDRGVEHWGFDAIIRLTEMARGARGLGRVLELPPLRLIGSRLYDDVARRRSCQARR